MEPNTKPRIQREELEVDHQLPPAPSSAEDSTMKGSGGAENQRTGPLERDELLDRAIRMQAEFENSRKRAAKELDEFKEFALENALKSLLPILDSFDLALQAPASNIEEFRSGIRLIRKQLKDALGKLGLRPIAAKGEPFDPLLHEAVEVVDTTDSHDNRIVEELQAGYKLNHRLLRPAMVRVARNQQEPFGTGEC